MNRLMLVLAGVLLPWGAAANDFPTIERVEYVLGCARDAQGSPRENIYKCACVIDAIAAKLTYDEYVQISTATNAFSIGGERGEVMRAYTGGREMAGRYRSIQAEARKGCFVR
ncbi:MAG: hypothetical protein Q7J47_15460 [Azoarcus sp.]|nr:hypothetical protein [Azoarcus sp.]